MDRLISSRFALVSMAFLVVIASATYFLQPFISSYLDERQAFSDAIIGEWHPDHKARRDVIEALDRLVSDHALHANGIRMAAHLQSMIGDTDGRSDVIPAWGLLLREAACANHRFGERGVALYIALKERTFNTPERQELFDRARQEIVRNGSRDTLYEAEENLDQCL